MTGILLFIAYGLLWGAGVIGPPACLLTYALLVAGRRLGGVAGMRIGAALGVALTCVPLLWIASFFLRAIVAGMPLVPEHGNALKSFLILGAGLGGLMSVLAMLFLVWSDQLLKAERRREARIG